MPVDREEHGEYRCMNTFLRSNLHFIRIFSPHQVVTMCVHIITHVVGTFYSMPPSTSTMQSTLFVSTPFSIQCTPSNYAIRSIQCVHPPNNQRAGTEKPSQLRLNAFIHDIQTHSNMILIRSTYLICHSLGKLLWPFSNGEPTVICRCSNPQCM